MECYALKKIKVEVDPQASLDTERWSIEGQINSTEWNQISTRRRKWSTSNNLLQLNGKRERHKTFRGLRDHERGKLAIVLPGKRLLAIPIGGEEATRITNQLFPKNLSQTKWYFGGLWYEWSCPPKAKHQIHLFQEVRGVHKEYSLIVILGNELATQKPYNLLLIIQSIQYPLCV